MVDRSPKVGRLQLQRQRPGLCQRDRAHVLDELLEDVELLAHGREMRSVCRVEAVLDRLELAGDDRQWRAQLVRRIRQERAATLVDRRQARTHVVERASERAHPWRPADRDARGVIAALDAFGRVRQLVEWRAHAPHAAECQHRGQRGHDEQADEEPVACRRRCDPTKNGPDNPDQRADRDEQEQRKDEDGASEAEDERRPGTVAPRSALVAAPVLRRPLFAIRPPRRTAPRRAHIGSAKR